MKEIKVALVGYGHLGKWHAQKADSLASLYAVIDPIAENTERAKENFPNIKTASELDEVLSEVDAVLVVTPTKYHFELCQKVLKAGKHLFCEKPVTETYKQALDLGKLNDSNSLVVQVGHSERCHEAIEFIKKYETQTSKSKVVKFTRTSSFKGRAGDVSVIEDLMIHDIDLALLLFGSPKTTKSFAYKKYTDHYDYCLSELIYENRSVFIEASRVAIDEIREVKFHGDGGELKIDLLNLEVSSSTGLNKEGIQVIHQESYEKRDHLYIEQEKFYQAISDKSDPFVSLEDGIKAMQVIEMIKKDLLEYES